MTPAGVQQQRSPKVKPVLHTVKQLKWYKALHWSCFSESDNLKPCVYLVDYRPNHCAENWTFFVGEHYKSWSLVGLFLTAQNSIDLWLRLKMPKLAACISSPNRSLFSIRSHLKPQCKVGGLTSSSMSHFQEMEQVCFFFFFNTSIICFQFYVLAHKPNQRVSQCSPVVIKEVRESIVFHALGSKSICSFIVDALSVVIDINLLKGAVFSSLLVFFSLYL